MAQMDECKKLSLGLNFEGIKDFFMDKFFFFMKMVLRKLIRIVDKNYTLKF